MKIEKRKLKIINDEDVVQKENVNTEKEVDTQNKTEKVVINVEVNNEEEEEIEKLKEYVRVHKLNPAIDTLRSLRFTIQSHKKYLEDSNTGNVSKKQRMIFPKDECNTCHKNVQEIPRDG
ncbi:hypothetical protein L1987_46120 [Smallanthus sonchifolius]|uniref:Uncharacterized protein n=1 Tax=Smallanthus sonchifolius TaxID=185202 RepID=A0ACB9FZW3_9ASTR|nr:hypothetical protein L1987_46120 [Smallanthus sonchifolius]